MRRGTNPELTFELPEAITVAVLYITFKQGDRIFPKGKLFTCVPVWRTALMRSSASVSPLMAAILKLSMRNGSKTWMPCW